jgi:hypothetical protein
MIRLYPGPTAVLLLSLLLPAQAARAAQSGQPEASSTPVSAPQVDVSRLPININRIHRQLRQTTVREERDGLNLRYIVDVYGQAPRIELFTKEDNLRDGRAPWGAPTHQDMLQIMTPQEYRSPAANFGNLFMWLADKAKK